MQRQKSILSFFQKPSPANQSSGAGDTINGQKLHFLAKQQKQEVTSSSEPEIHSHGSLDSSLEIRGTDTPPEKVPRQILPGASSRMRVAVVLHFSRALCIILLIQKDSPKKKQLLNILKRTMLSAPMGQLIMEA
ncbi:hypothetical protein GH714_039281 [Hevea brasiliensis]|uniref:Uncharacterized protein n=1 Tax=Hevea brasiliensis TaxID=3981 RepID=A0A6A6LHX4_HEVBR|nr:hypothetical protein GH714_039281 [Hevea brasiliensis]